jgi:hypothetical protein
MGLDAQAHIATLGRSTKNDITGTGRARAEPLHARRPL